MKIPNDEKPIFVVGVPRSGTTLLAAMLAAHSRLSCGPETRFFRFLIDTDLDYLYHSWPDNAVEFLFSIRMGHPIPTSIPKHYGLAREKIHAYLVERTATVPNILSALTEQYMQREEKHRWVEKSPEHLKYVHDIRTIFPHSPIVRIIRDPRDSALSMTNTHFAPRYFLEALHFWHNYDAQSAPFFRSDDNSYTLYYENLIQTPEIELRRLCAFLGEAYEDQMLDTSRSAASVITENETHKGLAYKPVDPTRIQVWKRELTKEENRVAEALIGDRLINYGYECVEKFDCVAKVYPSTDTLLRYRDALASFVSGGARFWPTILDDDRYLMIYVGDPDRDKWLSYEKPQRWRETLQIITQILIGRLVRRRLYWINDQDIETKLGFCSRMLVFFLRSAEKCRVT